MLVQRGYKFELKVNNKEQSQLFKGAGIARFAWNWGLADRIKRYKDNTGINRYTDAIRKKFSAPVNTVPWGTRIKDDGTMDLIKASDVISIMDILLSESD